MLCVLLLIVACAGSDPGDSQGAATFSLTGEGKPSSVTSDGWSITAEIPERVGDDLVRGSVTFERTSGAATRGGGACAIFAELNDKVPCETVDTCWKKLGPSLPKGAWLYCAGVNGQTRHKRCWTRPASNPCTRGRGRVPGTYFTPTVSALVEGRAVKWVTFACMGIQSNPGGCGSGDPSQSVHTTSPQLGPDDDDESN